MDINRSSGRRVRTGRRFREVIASLSGDDVQWNSRSAGSVRMLAQFAQVRGAWNHTGDQKNGYFCDKKQTERGSILSAAFFSFQ
jgi:hypothetical protein